jgi:hypothetical protein
MFKKSGTGRKMDRQTEFVDKLISASVANHNNSDRLGSLHSALQSKSSYLKTL